MWWLVPAISSAIAPLLIASSQASATVDASRDAPLAASQAQPLLEEIVVTARRREERLLDVPISASVFSAVELERLQLDNVSTLQYAAPNLTVTPYPGTQTRATIAMRGQLESDLFPTLDPAVGLYLDGVYIARMSGANLDLIDMQRVEVLRGPQGTLFGRNTIGGAIDLIPNRPTSEFGGTLTGGVGNYDLRDLTTIVNLPVADDYAIRLTASHKEHSGYARNTLLGHDLNSDDTNFARVQIAIAPEERWDLHLSFDVTRIDTPRNWATLLAAYPPNTLVPAARGHPDDSLTNYEHQFADNVRANRVGDADTDVWGTSGTLTVVLGRATVKSITAFRKLQSSDDNLDLDGTPYDLFTVLEREEHQHQFSEELEAYGDVLDGRLAWVSGLYFFDERGNFTQSLQAIAPVTLNDVINEPRGTVDNDSIAAYAQLTYAMTPNWRVTIGARYNHDERQLTSRNARILGGAETCALAPNLLDEPGVCEATLPGRTFDYVPYTLGVDFKPTDAALLYAKLSRGYRAGGYNMRGTTEVDLDTFEPERVTAYEIGAHADVMDRRLRLNLALYYSQFDDVQVVERIPGPPGTLPLPVIQNGGQARIEGGELEIAALLGDLRMAATVGVTDAKYVYVDPSVLNVTRDSEFLQTPFSTASVAADFPIMVGSGDVELHADYSWRNDVAFQYDPRSRARQDAYGLLNALLSTRFDQRKVGLRLWGRNLTDKHYLVRATDAVQLVTAMPGDPRSYGASLIYWFGARPQSM